MLTNFYNESPTKQKTRINIIETAVAIFTRSGMESPSMMEIADAAGITTRNLYRYYANKDLLIVDTAFYVLTTDQYALTSRSGESGFDTIERFLGDIFTTQYSSEKTVQFIIHFDLYIMNMDKSSDAYTLYTTKYVKAMNDMTKTKLIDVIERGVSDGSLTIQKSDAELYAEYIIQSVFSIFSRVIIKESENKAISKRLVEKQIEVILQHIKSDS